MRPDQNTTFFFRNAWTTPGQIDSQFLEHSLQFGKGISVELKAYSNENGSNIFKSNEYLEQFQNDVKKANLSVDYSQQDLTQIIHSLVNKNKFETATIRCVAYEFNGQSELMCCAWSSKPFAVRESLKVTTNKKKKKEDTYDVDAISSTLLMNDEGHLLGSQDANFFFIKDEIIYTPRMENHVPSGSTRSSIIEGAMALGYPVIEKNILLQDVAGSEAAFLSNGSFEMSFIETIDDYKFSGDWRATIAQDLLLMLRQIALNDNGIDYSII